LVFEELRRREAAHAAILYAFDVIEHNGADPRDCGFPDRKAALALVLPKPRRLLNDSPWTCPLRPTLGLSGLD
jgi:ATP-dependent DNA ligase